MPSEPETGPIRISTLSCSTSLRAPRIAESRARVGREGDHLDGLAAGLCAGLLHGDFHAADGILTERGERTFESREHADLDLLLRQSAAGHQRQTEALRPQVFSSTWFPLVGFAAHFVFARVRALCDDADRAPGGKPAASAWPRQ